jgi:hypothetical protein
MPKIYVTMEGGICQGVSTNDPALVGAEYVVIDYDVEGEITDNLHDVIQDNGETAEAYISGDTISRLTVQIVEREGA